MMAAKVVPLRSAPRPRSVPDRPVAALVLEAQAGDEAALHALFDKHVDRVYRLVRLLMPKHPDPDDVVQDVFVRAIESLPRLRSPEAFPGWLRAVTVHTVRNKIRHRRFLRRIGFLSADDSNEAEVDRLTTREAPPDVRAELMGVYRTLERLSTDSHLALVLQRVEGLTLDEIAVALRVSVATVKRRLATAEVELQSELSRRRA